MTAPALLSRHKMFNGFQERYRHASAACACDMNFSIYLPPQTAQGYRVPVLYWLSGLGSSDENFVQKAGAQRFAAQWGIALVAPDTSPRGDKVPDSSTRGIGHGAGFYVNATEAPWAEHYQMYTYITEELPALIEAHFPVTAQRSIAGHSMGGHGALQIALKNPERYAAVSTFAPVAHPSEAPLAQAAFAAYLGDNRNAWAAYDSTALVQTATKKLPVFIDQGSDDEFYADLLPEDFVNAARANGFDVLFKKRAGYGHDYHFVASFIDSHIEFHADALGL